MKIQRANREGQLLLVGVSSEVICLAWGHTSFLKQFLRKRPISVLPFQLLLH
jgi:hypothetical protein